MRPAWRSAAVTALVYVMVMTALLPGCRSRQHRAHVQEALGEVDKTMLVAEARRIWERHRSNWTEELPSTEWPQVFRHFNPEKVIVGRSGVFVCTHAFFVREAGLFIALDAAFAPEGKTDPIYERLDGPFYWYDANG